MSLLAVNDYIIAEHATRIEVVLRGIRSGYAVPVCGDLSLKRSGSCADWEGCAQPGVEVTLAKRFLEC
jgi:hypothetical protein